MNWQLKRDTPEVAGRFLPRIVVAPKQVENFLSSYQVAGHRHAQSLVRNQQKIPTSWREYNLIFLGSEWIKEPAQGEWPEETCYTRLIFSRELNTWGISFFWGDNFPQNFKAVTYQIVTELI